MNTFESVCSGRDPIAFAIEKYLRFVEQDGPYRLSVKKRPEGVRVRFAGYHAESVSLDAALVQLGALLLTKETFREALTKVLRGPMAMEDAYHQRAACRAGAAVGTG